MILNKFDGETYEPAVDGVRLKAQLERVKKIMLDGEWRSLKQLHDLTGDPEQSISARLRDLRKEKFGRFAVDRKRIGDPKMGVFYYRVRPPVPPVQTEFQFQRN